MIESEEMETGWETLRGEIGFWWQIDKQLRNWKEGKTRGTSGKCTGKVEER